MSQSIEKIVKTRIEWLKAKLKLGEANNDIHKIRESKARIDELETLLPSLKSELQGKEEPQESSEEKSVDKPAPKKKSALKKKGGSK